MKNLILLNRLGFNPNLTTRQSRVDSVSNPCRCRVLATLLLCLTLFVGSGNVWGAYTYSGTGTFNKQSTIDGDGYYVIIFTNSGAMTNDSPASNYVGVNTGYNGTSSNTISDPATSVVLQVTNYDSTNKKYYINNNSGNYLYSSGDKKIAYSATAQYWEIATVSSKVRLKTAQATVVYMGYYSGSGFRPYENSGSNVQSVSAIYKLAASCDKNVTITKGTPESGGSFDLDKTGSQATCSGLTVTVSNIVAPSGKKFSAITQSGIASGVTIDQSAKTVTYAANTTGGPSTINVTYEDKGCVDHAGDNAQSYTGTGYTYGPVDAYYEYNTRQILYTKADLGLAAGKKGVIKSIYFRYAYGTAMSSKTSVKIYMANTSLAALSTSNYVTSFTEVYSGALNGSGNGTWNEIMLDSPFNYDGIGNLVVVIDDNSNAYDGTDYVYSYHTASTTSGAQLYTRSASSDADPTAAATWTGAKLVNYRPATKFCIQEADMTPATVTLMDNGATITEPSAGAGVTLPSRAGCTGYKFEGWTKTWVAPQSSWTTTAPDIIEAGSYTPTTDENLYPVYTKTEGGGEPETVTLYYEPFTGSAHSTGVESTNVAATTDMFVDGSATVWSHYSFDAASTAAYANNYGGETISDGIKIKREASNTTVTMMEVTGIKISGASDLELSLYNRRTHTSATLNISYKIDDGSYTAVGGTISYNSTNDTWKKSDGLTISGTGTSLDLKIELVVSGATNRTMVLEDIKITGVTGGSTTYYISVPDCCDNIVELSTGTLSHCTMSISPTNLQTCSGTATDRQVTITVTPDAGYEMNSEARLTFTKSSGTATATYVSGPTTVGATYQFVYKFTKDDNGAGTFGATCTAKTYRITLNNNGATTTGTEYVDVVYNTAPAIFTPPTKEGYNFQGYYTNTGSPSWGSKLGNNGGTWAPNVANYTSSGNWIKAADVTLYAKWEEKALTNYRTTCGVEITVSGSVWLTSYANVAVYTTNSPNNLITVTCTDFGSATRLGVKYIHNGDAVAKTSSPFRLCYYGFPGKADYNKADGDGTAGGYDYINLSSDAKTAIASGQTFAIEYTPAADEYDQEDTYTIRLAALDGSTDKGYVDFTVHGRALPEQFVIASKVGDQWYALPNTILDNKRAIEPIEITVDNTTTPTRATNAPNTTAYQGTGRYAPGTNRYGIRLADPSGHWLQVSSSSETNYVWVSGTGSSTCQDWNLSSTDFGAYTLTVPSSGAGDKKMGIKSGNMGYYASPDDPSQQIYLLPADFYTEAEAQILKWKANSVVVMYTGTQTTATTQVGSNSASSAQTLSSQKLTHGIYELTTAQSLASNDGKTLLLGFGDTKKAFDIPLIINSDVTATSGHDKQDVVIVNGGKLTAAATKYSFRNVYVYGGGKLAIPSGTSLGTNDIILRAGGISTNGSGGSATYEYVYPQFSLIGTLTNSSGKFRYEYVTDYDHWYQLCLPFNATLSSITYPQEYYGDNVEAANTGSWVIKRYAGEVRATGSYDAWKDIEKDSPAKTEVTAGQGYIFWGAPKKVTINGDKQRQQWGIQRMTMTIAAGAATTAETNDKNISVDSYSDVEGKSTKPNDQGWNLVGNPYMVNLTDWSSESMIAGQLVPTETVPWDGKWRNNGDGIRYVTIPDNHFDSYVAKTASVAAGAGDFMPGRAFFVQIAEGATTLTFAATNRASLMPALRAKTEVSIDVETGIVMSDESKQDEMNFWIKDGKTAEYEVNADYPKTPNSSNFNIYGVHSHGDLSWIAISPEIAEGSMPIGYQVPGEGEYMLSLSETYVSDKIEHMFVTDHAMNPEVTVDLMDGSYEFTVNQAETNNERFTISIKLKEDNPGILTGVESLDLDIERPIKFIYQDKLYILRGGVIYDATGKRVREVNK